ncbi:hypothetical protein J6590_049233 [Homalodisca vitripennis]|nr:hypothetical protein J6590_049233 [Homalodisca vitripennis]
MADSHFRSDWTSARPFICQPTPFIEFIAVYGEMASTREREEQQVGNATFTVATRLVRSVLDPMVSAGEWQRRQEREISKRNGWSGSGGHRVYYLARKHLVHRFTDSADATFDYLISW